ncbi:MAG: alpha/beta hydrolase [Pseudomonadota bacterium]
MLKLLATAFLALLLAGCGSQHLGKPETAAPAPVVSSYAITRDVVVSPADWPKTLLADVYTPSGPGPFPSVLLIHGGAWKRGDRAQVKGLAERIAARGYLVVNTTYRLVPEYIFPAQLQDVQQAAQWMRRAGSRYGIDPQRIGAYGYSAGGHLSALVAAAANDPVLGLADTQMKAVVAGGTPSDLTLYEGGYLVPNFIGGKKSAKLAAFKAASPALYVKPGHPPVFQYHATLDDYVPFEQAEKYKARLDAAAVPNELFVIKGHGHISAFFADGEAVEASLAFLDRYLR